jgi:HK97 family phage major capsid protein
MMKITKALRDYFLAKGWITAADVSDDVVKSAVTAKLLSGELDAGKLHELQDEKAGVKGIVAQMVKEAMAPVLEAIAGLKGQNPPGPNPVPVPAPTPTPTPTPAPDVNAEVSKAVREQLVKAGVINADGTEVSPQHLFSKAAQAGWLGGSPRVKSPLERYDQSRSAAHWGSDSKHLDLRGKRLTTPSPRGPGLGRPLDIPSKADEAIVGAYFKWALAANSPGEVLPRGLRMNEHDWELVKHAMHEMPWTGCLGGEWGESVDGAKLTDMQRKALLDDSVSGGIWAVPLVLDDAIIMTPLLYGELFPLVDVVNLNQGRRIEAFTFGTPTFTSGIPEGTAIPLFDTTNFLGALDTVIQNAVGAMELGNDFEEDSPANIGAMVVARYGEAALQWLDMVVALGDGTTQPKGIFNTSGTTAVASASGAAGPLTIGDLEGLMFGVNKAYRTSKGGRNVYIGNEVSYRRFRGIPTGTAFNTRAFGMDYGDYMALGFPYKIHPSIPNNKIAFVNMAWYRMYRRLGTQVKVERGGKELSLKNLTLIVVRMRYGGQLTSGGAAAIMTDAAT